MTTPHIVWAYYPRGTNRRHRVVKTYWDHVLLEDRHGKQFYADELDVDYYDERQRDQAKKALAMKVPARST